MLIRKIIYTAAILIVPFVLMGGSCSTDPNFSSNITSLINVTGNYDTATTPNPDINNMTLTQTGNYVKGVDDQGTIYEGTSTGDIPTLTVSQVDASTGMADVFTTTAIQLTGRGPDGRSISLILTHVNAQTQLPVDPSIIVSDPGDQITNITNIVFIRTLAGTYTDSTGLAGSFVLESHVVN